MKQQACTAGFGVKQIWLGVLALGKLVFESELRNKHDVRAKSSPGKEIGAEMPPFCPKQFNPAVKTAALEMQGTF